MPTRHWVEGREVVGCQLVIKLRHGRRSRGAAGREERVPEHRCPACWHPWQDVAVSTEPY